MASVSMTDTDIDLESQAFREALLSQLNGQTEAMQKFIGLVDTRFQSQGRRLREHRREHAADRQRMERIVVGALVAAPGITLAIVKTWDILT